MRRPLISLVCLLALLAASCAGGGPSSDDRTGSVGGAIDVPGEPPTSAESPDAGSSGAPQDDGAGPATSARPRSGVPAPPPTSASSAGTAATDRSWLGPPGSYARRLLQPTPARSVVLEVFEQDGAGPMAASVSHTQSTVGRVSGKQVTVAGPVPVDGGAKAWSAEELRTLADERSQVQHSADRAVVRMLFLRGTFGGNDKVLGVALRGDVMAVFTDRVAASATVLVPRSTLEKAVTLHEMGHLLGLVGLVVNPGRQDPDHPGHSSNRESVMFWAVESSVVGQVLGGPPSTEFDEDDLADLATIRRGG